MLGGTSLFAGRGSVLPGTVLGAVLIHSAENGLVILNADPYLYPLVTSGIILLAVLLDSGRARLLAGLQRRQILVQEAPGAELAARRRSGWVVRSLHTLRHPFRQPTPSSANNPPLDGSERKFCNVFRGRH